MGKNLDDAHDADLTKVFAVLREIMREHQSALVLLRDNPGSYALNTHNKRADGYVFWFGGVEIKKNHVSYHLMPIYEHPELLAGVSEALKKRMQGKSCFNFKKPDAALFAELAALTQMARKSL